MTKNKSGFTIVELLIVIVVIGILATITIVAYNGAQARARDTKRQSDLAHIAEAIELYYADNGGYPTCSGGTYVPGAALGSGTVANCLASLVPKYLPSMPQDPTNTGSYRYWYAYGYYVYTTNGFTGNKSDNYMIGNKLETSTLPQYSGWGPTDLNYLYGSKN